jgi:hypothetical protein
MKIYARAPSNVLLTMSWLARLGRRRQAEAAREHARLSAWESEGGSQPTRPRSATAPTSPAART